MGMFLTLAFLFFIGSVFGWVLELLFRRFISSANPERKWINPGFCTGPYVPLYGVGLCILYLIAGLEAHLDFIPSSFWRKAILFLVMALCMTAIEYVAGVFCLRVAKVRLWDYSHAWGNIQGLICPKFSMIWAALGAVYYFLIHPHILNALDWLAHNLAFSFVIGMFYGVFLMDLAHSVQLAARLRAFAEENQVIIKYENLKSHIRSIQEKEAQKYRFFRPFYTPRALAEHLQERLDTWKVQFTADREQPPDSIFSQLKKRKEGVHEKKVIS